MEQSRLNEYLEYSMKGLWTQNAWGADGASVNEGTRSTITAEERKKRTKAKKDKKKQKRRKK